MGADNFSSVGGPGDNFFDKSKSSSSAPSQVYERNTCEDNILSKDMEDHCPESHLERRKSYPSSSIVNDAKIRKRNFYISCNRKKEKDASSQKIGSRGKPHTSFDRKNSNKVHNDTKLAEQITIGRHSGAGNFVHGEHNDDEKISNKYHDLTNEDLRFNHDRCFKQSNDSKVTKKNILGRLKIKKAFPSDKSVDEDTQVYSKASMKSMRSVDSTSSGRSNKPSPSISSFGRRRHSARIDVDFTLVNIPGAGLSLVQNNLD